MTTSYEPPADIWEVNARLQLDEPLEGEDDPRWVDTMSARGENSLLRLKRVLGVNVSHGRLAKPPARGYYLFCGHRGCGKSTELRRIRNDLDTPDIYYVVFADAAQELDVNNLRYQDILLHLAGKLMERLENDRIGIDDVHLQRLQDWFMERAEMRTVAQELALGIGAGGEMGMGIPGLAKLSAWISNSFKTNSTHKEELRRTLQNYFTDFADAFNHLIEAAEEAIRTAGRDRRILFVIDGTDRLSGDDAQAFFVSDVHQLQQVYGLFVYCAPIHLAYEGSTIGQSFDDIFQLPMMKVTNEDGSPNRDGRDAMRRMLYLRAARSLFDDGVADSLIEYSGGHPRDLFRLLLNAFKYAENDRFDESSARQAVREAATDFRRFLHPEDYELLASMDSTPASPIPSERTRNLLYNLALLEYNNNIYWRSHPVIRTTDAYRAARRALDTGFDG